MRSRAKRDSDRVTAARARLPLSALLSQVLVAFTIEFDNESERRIQHWTTRHGSTGGARGVWLASLVMFSNCMQFVGEDGVRVGELEKLARTHADEFERHGKVAVHHRRAGPSGQPAEAATFRLGD